MLYVTNNGGVSWVSHRLPGLCAQVKHVAASSTRDTWALSGAATPSDIQTKELYRSVDAGSTWMLVASSNSPTEPGAGRLPASGIVTQLISVGVGHLLMAFDNGTLIESTDNGRSWAPQGLPASGGVIQLTFTDARDGWAIVSPNDALYRTSDGGAHWATPDRH